MAKATITIDQDKCDGCEECIISCPSEALDIKDGKVVVVRDEDCLVCRTCAEICPKAAINVLEV